MAENKGAFLFYTLVSGLVCNEVSIARRTKERGGHYGEGIEGQFLTPPMANLIIAIRSRITGNDFTNSKGPLQT